MHTHNWLDSRYIHQWLIVNQDGPIGFVSFDEDYSTSVYKSIQTCERATSNWVRVKFNSRRVWVKSSLLLSLSQVQSLAEFESSPTLAEFESSPISCWVWVKSNSRRVRVESNLLLSLSQVQLSSAYLVWPKNSTYTMSYPTIQFCISVNFLKCWENTYNSACI